MRYRRTIFFILALCGLIAVFFLYKYFNPADYSFFPKCPIQHFTGWECPGCGGQRAAHHLVNGEIKAAFLQNPLLFFLTPYMALGVYLQTVPAPTRSELKLRKNLYGYYAIWVLATTIVLYTLIRNLI